MEDRFNFRFYDLDKKIMIKPSDEMTEEEWDNVCSTYGKDDYYCCIEATMTTILGHFDYDDYYKKHFAIMQCTGLKDKNGKLIYEGDIIKTSYCSEYAIGDVAWDNEYLQFSMRANGGFYSFIQKSPHDKIEILGNIYENSDLLSEVEG